MGKCAVIKSCFNCINNSYGFCIAQKRSIAVCVALLNCTSYCRFYVFK